MRACESDLGRGLVENFENLLDRIAEGNADVGQEDLVLYKADGSASHGVILLVLNEEVAAHLVAVLEAHMLERGSPMVPSSSPPGTAEG